MVTELSHDDYPMLLGELERYLPRSCMTYYPLKLMIKGIIKDRKIWVDGWPNVNCLVISDGKQKRVSPRRGLAFCRSPEFVTSMHQSLKAVAEFLEEPIEICGLTKNITEAIRHSKSYEKSTDTLSDSYGTKLYSTDRNSLIKMTVPADITVSHLTSDYLDMVINSWKFSGSYEDANEYFKFLINDLLTICLFDPNGKPIAWGLQQDHGCLGMVYVVPEYRRRGLGSLVISLLAEKMLEYDEIVYVTIEFDNKASFEMHEKLGFRDACKDMDFMWSLYTIN